MSDSDAGLTIALFIIGTFVGVPVFAWCVEWWKENTTAGQQSKQIEKEKQ